MLPKGSIKPFADDDSFTSKFVSTYFFESLCEDDEVLYDSFFTSLLSKYQAKANTINMRDLVLSMKVNEVKIRLFINKFEYEFIGFTYFIITDGGKDWKEIDQIRIAKVQKRDYGVYSKAKQDWRS